MKGVINVKIADNRSTYKFDLYRNITLVQGKSGSGKTTLYQMVVDHGRFKENSPIQVKCDKKCVALLPGDDWKYRLSKGSAGISF